MIEPVYRKETLIISNPILRADENHLEQVKDDVARELGIVVLSGKILLNPDHPLPEPLFEIDILRKITP